MTRLLHITTRAASAHRQWPRGVPLLGVALGLGAMWLACFKTRAGPSEDAQMRSQAARWAEQLDHDVRTPIGTIASALALIEDSDGDAALRDEAVDIIGRQVARLTQSAQGLRDLARTLRTTT